MAITDTLFSYDSRVARPADKILQPGKVPRGRHGGVSPCGGHPASSCRIRRDEWISQSAVSPGGENMWGPRDLPMRRRLSKGIWKRIVFMKKNRTCFRIRSS